MCPKPTVRNVRRGWRLAGLIVVLAFGSPASGAAADLRVRAVYLSQAPVIDGVLDNEVWTAAEPVGGFVQIEPQYGEPSPFQTVVLVGYTEETLYVAFRCFDPEPAGMSYAVTSRDGPMASDDSVSVLIDTFHDRRTAYFFSTNSLGVQSDGKVADNGRTVDVKWDASWR